MNKFETGPGPKEEREGSKVDITNYQRQLTEGTKRLGFAFYEAVMKFRQNLLVDYSEEELRQSALYHVLIGSTPEAEHKYQTDDPVNQRIMAYLDAQASELAEAGK